MPEDTSMILDLVDWASEHQTSLHADVEVYQDPLTGLSFRAAKSLPLATKIVTCSYQTTLSYLNATAASSAFQNHQSAPFPSEFIEALQQDDPNIIGHFFLVEQFLMGEKSFWWHYIKLLPQPDQPEKLGIPIWWPEDDRRFLEGTNAEPPIKKREEMWRAEWAKGVAHLREKFENWEEYTYPLYQWAATIFGSRSFRASLTIPEELMGQSQALPDDLSLTLDHIKKDRFSVLLPLMDIGNHNGVNQVDWLPDPIAGHFSLSIRDAISEGCQIFNYYGHKSNSELLVAYGFILPTPENDKVNLKLTPSPDAMQLRRSQFCHAVHDHSQPEQEFMFDVKTSNGEPGLQDVLKSFSEGLIDTLVCMVANAGEREFITESPGYCIEKASDPLGRPLFDPFEVPLSDPSGDALLTAVTENAALADSDNETVSDPPHPLSRALIRALSILCEKLGYETERIETSGAKLSEPQNSNQRLALEYRQGQLRVLEGALASVSNYVQHSISFNHLCRHTLSQTSDKANFLSLECAFGWLQQYYLPEYTAVIKLIADDQEEPLPLKWSIIVEEWDNTYWIVWIFLLWMLWNRDKDAFEKEHEELWVWVRSWDGIFHGESIHTSELNQILRADPSEESTIDNTIKAILKLPGFEHVVSRGLLRFTKYQTNLRNFISYVVQEETILLPYTMQHPPQYGEQVPQKMLHLPSFYDTTG